MVNIIPESWKYNNTMEMLFLFYQYTDELLSETTPDTYMLPLHNAITAFSEIEEIYDLLNRYDIVSTYYSKYIPPIINEFLSLIEDDYILKRILGKRLESIRTGFTEAIKQANLLERWIGVFNQACGPRRYREEYRQEIINLVENTNDKNKLRYCSKNYYISLISLGYTREYLYITAKKYFDNKKVIIKDKEQIKDFLERYSCRLREFEFLVLMDTDVIDYLGTISDNISISKCITKIDVRKERKDLCRDYIVNELFKEYDKKIHAAGIHERVAVIKFKYDAYDPYCAAISLELNVKFLQTFTHYFKHFYPSKQIFMFALKTDDGYYREIKLPRKYQKRPFVSQQTIDSRITNILTAKSMSPSAFFSLAGAVSMHAEAFDSRNTTILLRTFWTALETLFSNPSPKSMRENVINSILPIIQKTYILKILRTLYSQLSDAIGNQALEGLGINSFPSFVKFFAAYSEESDEMKNIYGILSHNPLLRSRLYNIRKAFRNGMSIGKMLDVHKTRIEWQLTRLYRYRNIATHLGVEMWGLETVANHLHNYFDYAVNYMLCKSENGDYIESISTLVFEAMNDNKIHRELLKTDDLLSEKNYMSFLFGPDANLINYQFE